MTIGLSVVTLLGGFVFLIKGADFLVEGAVGIARRLNVSDLVIGIYIISDNPLMTKGFL